MKRLIFILLLFPACLLGQVSLQQVNIGNVANDGTGDAIRTAFQKVNANATAVEAGHNALVEEVRDTIPFFTALSQNSAYIQSLINASLESYSGGATGKIYVLSGITGVTGNYPGPGDSLITHSSFVGKDVKVWRDGQYQQRHSTNNYFDGYRYNSSTGTLTFRPVFGTNEQVDIWVSSSILWESLIPEEAGGLPPASHLLNNLKAYWALDEVSGTTVNDSHGTYNGVTNATVNSAGILGRSETFARASSQYAYFGSEVGDMGTDDFSVSLWIYVTSYPNTDAGIIGNWGAAPYWYLTLVPANQIMFCTHFTSSNIMTYSNAAITRNKWVHVAVTVDRDGYQRIYVDGVLQNDSDDVSAHASVIMNNNRNFNIGNIGGQADGYYFNGLIDEVALFQGIVLSQADVTALYNSGSGKAYPFAP